MAIFATVATALAGVLTSSISARSLASQRTAAEQIANDQLEWIRSLDYDAGRPQRRRQPIGHRRPDRRPVGAGRSRPFPRGYTVSIDIFWVDDPVPTAIDDQGELQERRRHRVSRQRLEAALVAEHAGRAAAAGGVRRHQQGNRQRQVQDYLHERAVPERRRSSLHNGPSSPLGDTTDAAGAVRFPALDAATGSTYYDLVVPPFNGYIHAAGAQRHALPARGRGDAADEGAAGVQARHPHRRLQDSDGTPFVGTVVFTVANSRGSKSYTYTGTPVTVTSITNSTTGATELLVPGSYTITVTNQVGGELLHRRRDARTFPNLSDYPTDLTATATIDRRPARVDQRHGDLGAAARSPGRPSPSPAARGRSPRERRRRTRAGSRRSPGSRPAPATR